MDGSVARRKVATKQPADQRQGVPSDSKAGERRLLRFDRVERAAHWINATLFAVLMATALPLYFVQVEALVGRRELIVEIHTWCGIALPVPLMISLAGPWGARFRRDVRRFSLWMSEETRWLRERGRERLPELDKFNPGQKLNALFVGGSIVVMLGTGAILKWFQLFPLDWRTGATFVHDVLAAAIFVVVFGHIAFALAHRDALRSIFKGWVTESWAARHAPRWLQEEKAVVNASDSTPPNDLIETADA
jgi:formate dehydrogenase subunit gamma